MWNRVSLSHEIIHFFILYEETFIYDQIFSKILKLFTRVPPLKYLLLNPLVDNVVMEGVVVIVIMACLIICFLTANIFENIITILIIVGRNWKKHIKLMLFLSHMSLKSTSSTTDDGSYAQVTICCEKYAQLMEKVYPSFSTSCGI